MDSLQQPNMLHSTKTYSTSNQLKITVAYKIKMH